MDLIKSHLPDGDRLIEPFVGAGSVFLNTDYKEYLLCDISRDLIHLYHNLKEGGEGFIDHCESLFSPLLNNEGSYRAYRDQFNLLELGVERSAIFLYLNRHGFNGLCRYNRKGMFNVPFGRYDAPYFPRPEMLYFLEKINAVKVDFAWTDFRNAFGTASEGDVFYCDPPYAPIGEAASFTTYDKVGFSLDDQVALANLARNSARAGATVVLSNHSTEYVRDLYAGAKITEFFAGRSISCKGDRRDKVRELLAVFDANHLGNISLPFTPAMEPTPKVKKTGRRRSLKQRILSVLAVGDFPSPPYKSSDILENSVDVAGKISSQSLLAMVSEADTQGLDFRIKGCGDGHLTIVFEGW